MAQQILHRILWCWEDAQNLQIPNTLQLPKIPVPYGNNITCDTIHRNLPMHSMGQTNGRVTELDAVKQSGPRFFDNF